MKISKLVIVSITVATFCLYGFSAYTAENKYYKIIDTNGKGDIVYNLLAHYTAGGQWIGGRPEEHKTSFRFEYYFVKKEGRATFKKTHDFEIPFNEIDSVRYQEKVNKVFTFQYTINKLDGSSIIISSTKYEKKNKNGDVVSSETIDGKRCVIGYHNEYPISLEGFSAKVESNGEIGEYYIRLNEVSEIFFNMSKPVKR